MLEEGQKSFISKNILNSSSKRSHKSIRSYQSSKLGDNNFMPFLMNGVKHRPSKKASNRQAEMYLNKTSFSKKNISKNASFSRTDNLNRTEVLEGDSSLKLIAQ
jgi:hypothetical protein